MYTFVCTLQLVYTVQFFFLTQEQQRGITMFFKLTKLHGMHTYLVQNNNNNWSCTGTCGSMYMCTYICMIFDNVYGRLNEVTVRIYGARSN